MEADEEQRVVPFQLQFDKPVPSQIKMAEWNPEKDLLAMVSEDSKVVLHRFNWQRLWTISPGKCIMSLCWRPDGKAVAVGLEDGTISLHDVENGKLLKSMKSHNAAVVCLHWVEEDGQLNGDDRNNDYEDRASRFFPPAPRVPRMHTVVSGDPSFMDEDEDSFQELLGASHQRFNILCSADKDGRICFSIFGIFPIAKISIQESSACISLMDKKITCQIVDASIFKVSLSKDLCHLVIICSGAICDNCIETGHQKSSESTTLGMHCLVLDTSIFSKRKNELYQVALQASHVEDLTEVIRASISVMYKQWCDAMHLFHEKFESLSTLINSHGLESLPEEELFSLLVGARTSPPLHQFLVNSLGEGGLKRLTKSVHSAGKELQLIVLNHLQPAAEIIAFRVGELRGLSRWHARFGGIGLDETLIENATERVGMLLVQVQHFLKILSSVVQLFTNFFSWLLKCIKILMSDGNDQFPSYDSELVVLFLKFLYDKDPIRLLLDQSSIDHHVKVDMATMQRVEELSQLGGFIDTEFLQKTLVKEFQLMDLSFKEAFQMPHTTISKKIVCTHLLPLFPFPHSSSSIPSEVPASISFYKDMPDNVSAYQTCQRKSTDYISFKVPNGTFSHAVNCIGVVRGVVHNLSHVQKGNIVFEASLISIPCGFNCVDISLYKEHQIVMILNEATSISEGSGNARMMVLQTSGLPFVDTSQFSNLWKLQELKDSVFHLQMEDEKIRSIPHNVIPPLAVSSSRGVACVFAARKRALVYILEEDEEDEAASEMD